MMLHSDHRWPEAVKKYFDEIASGKQYPPVYRHDFKQLDEHPKKKAERQKGGSA